MRGHNLGLEGEDEVVVYSHIPLEIHEPTGEYGALHYMHILNAVPSAIAFDISKSGTGYAKWENNELTCGTFSLKGIKDNQEMREHFRQQVKEIFGTSTFPYVVIEDVIGSCNFTTANVLYQLNPIIDDMMLYNMIPKGTIYREDNGTWRKHLKGLADYKPTIIGYSDTKKIAQDCLDKLLVPRIWSNDNESDAIGLLLSTLAFRVLKYQYVTKQKKYSTNIKKGYNLKQYSTTEAVNQFLAPIPQEKIVYEDLEGVHTDIFKASKQLLETHGTDKCFVVRIETEKCTTLILDNEKNGFSFSPSPCYIVFTHKESFNRKK